MSETYIFGNVGQSNAQIGTNTMLNTTGAGNSAFGNNVFTYLTSGANNSGFGVEVASSLSFNGSNNTVYGVEVMKDATTASDTSGFGYQALTALTSGNNNSSFGLASGNSLNTTSNNTLFGANANLVNNTVSNALVIGNDTIGADQSIVVGPSAQCLSTLSATRNIVTGFNSKMGENSTNSTLIGSESGNTGPLVNTVSVGADALTNPLSLCENGVFIGIGAGNLTLSSIDDTFIGEYAGTNGRGERNTGIGYQSLYGSGTQYRSDNTGVGYYTAGTGGAGEKTTLIGYSAGEYLEADRGCTSIGGRSMRQVRGTAASSISSTVQSTINAHPDFITSNDGNLVVFTVNTAGNVTDVSAGTAATGGVGELNAVFKVRDGSSTLSEKFAIDTQGAIPASLGGKYFLISSATDYYVWYDVDNLSVDPAVPARTAIQVDISAGDSSTTIAFKTYSAIRNEGGYRTIFTESVSGSFFRIINNVAGNVTDVAAGTAVGPGLLSAVVKVRDGGLAGEYSFVDCTGVGSGIAGKYFLLSSTTTDYYVWFNTGSDVDPAVPARTGIVVNLSFSNYNTAVGWQSLAGHIVGGLNLQNVRENTAIGYSAGADLNTGSNFNTLLGYNSFINDVVVSGTTAIGTSISSFGTTDTTIIGTNVTSGSARNVLVGNNSSGSTDSLALGTGASAGVGVYQIGPNSVSGTNTLSFRTQIVADEAWIGGGTSSLVIDNSGNLVRGTSSLLVESTTDATATTMETYTMADNTTRQVEALIMGTRKGGVIGSTAQSYSVRLDAAIKRTGVLVTINKVTETHLQDMIAIGKITNQVAGFAPNIDGGTAVTAGGLSTVTTSTDGVGASLTETLFVNFYGSREAGYYPGSYFYFSSPTTDYYVWFANIYTPDPNIAGKTGIQVLYNFGDDLLTLLQLTATAIHNVGGAGTTFNCQYSPSTVVEVIYDTGLLNTSNIEPGTAVSGTPGSLNAVFTSNEGVSTYERSIIDTYGATPAGLAGRWFIIYGTFAYYVWYRVDGVTTDPGPGGLNNPYLTGKTGIMVDIVTGDSDSVIATKTSTTLESHPSFTTYGSALRITNNITGATVLSLSYSNNFYNYFLSRTQYIATHTVGSIGVAQEVIMSFAGQTGITMRPQQSFYQCAYFKISTTTTSYYFWYSYPGYTVAPFPGGIGVQIMLSSTDNEITIAQKTRNAVNGTGVFTVTNLPEHLSIHNVASGPALNPATDFNAVSQLDKIYSIDTIRNGTTAAVAEISLFDAKGATPATLGGKYFLLSSTTSNYYVWYNTDGGSVDPGLSATAIPVAIVTGDTETDIVNKTVAAIGAVGGGAVFTTAASPQWTIDIVASGTNAILEVSGSEGMNVTWKAYTRNFAL